MLPKHHKTSFFLKAGLFDNLSNFAELEDRISKQPTTTDVGDAFEVFAEAYFFTQKIEQAEEVWPFKAVPSSIREDLSLGTNQQDMGVDGVYKTTSGQFNAYQAKFRTGRPSLTWREISTFMGLTDNVSQRVLFTNSSDMPSVINDRTGFHCIRGNDFDRLNKNDFETILKWLQSGDVEVERKTPLPHQNEAIKDILTALNDEDRATALMACGTGKTLVALWVSQQMNCQSTIVLLPSLTLVRQTLHEWLRETEWQHLSYLCVCSDPTVASKELDSIKINQSDLDFAVTTDSSYVKQFLSQDANGISILFSTYQSAHIVAEGMDNNFSFDLGIFDEAHKTAGREGKKFGFALKNDNLYIRKRLFLTATPRHYNLTKRNKEGDLDLAYSMDSTDVYGNVAHNLSFAKAASQDIICKYKVIISVVTSEQVNKEMLKRGEVLINGEEVNAQLVAHQIAFKEAIDKYNIKRVFTFHKSINSAKLFTGKGSEGIHTQLPGFNTFHVNGTMSTTAREGVMNEFKDSDYSVISNARCLTEGVDLPAVDMVAFMSPKKSKVDIVQATGRAMRKDPRNPDKSLGYIFVPIYLETTKGESIEDAVAQANFGEIWNILQALQEQDDVLADIISQMQMDKGRYGKYKDAGFGDKAEVLGVDISLKTLQGSITAVCLERLGSTWDIRYGELIKYKEIYGNCKVPDEWPENKQFANWVKIQRQKYGHGTLSVDHIVQLESLGFVWDINMSRWEDKFEALMEYKKQYGNCNVPQNHSGNRQLSSWITLQRVNYRKETLRHDQVKRLEDLGFVWDPLELQWEEMFKALKEYKERHGDCNVPARGSENKQLGLWVSKQRAKYENGMLSKDQIKRLDDLGIIWNPHGSKWEVNFEALKKYKERRGDCDVSRGCPENKKLAFWITNQRSAFIKKTLSTDRIKRLEDLGFVWDTFEMQLENRLEELKQYKEKYGDCNVPARWAENMQLGGWVAKQRRNFEDGILGIDVIKRLEGLGFVWDQFESKWEEKFNDLKKYKDEYGDCNVYKNCPENKELVAWIVRQRTSYRKEKLNEDQIDRLENLGFVWNPYKSKLEEKLDDLKKYKEEYGDCNVPANWPENKELAQWVRYQRSYYKRNGLDKNLIKRLETLGFIWDPLQSLWGKHFKELKKYKERFGDCDVPANWPENKELAQWVRYQRSYYKRNSLDKDLFEKLEDIGFTFEQKNIILKSRQKTKKEKWIKSFGELRTHKEQYGVCNSITNCPENKQLEDWISRQRTAYKRGQLDNDQVKCLETLGFIWDPLQSLWEMRFEELKEYKEKFGDCKVPGIYPEKKQLGVWVNNQRVNYRKKKLNKDQIKRLEDIDFIWNINELKWEEMYTALQEYKERYGDSNVHGKWPKNQQLGKWVNSQRVNYRRGNLSDDQVKRLVSLGFVWGSNRPKWEEMFDILKEYKERYENCNVPHKWPENQQLAMWVITQRTNYRSRKISDERIKCLESLGFIWNPLELLWMTKFRALEKYKKKHGNCDVPNEGAENKQLCSWVRTQRTNYNQGRLSDDHIKQLEELEFVWDPFELQWKDKFVELKKYKKKFGDCNVPEGWPENITLATWVNRQRNNYRTKTISADRIKYLEDLGFIWKLRKG